MKKIKNAIFAAIFTLSFGLMSPQSQASGILTFDAASLMQTLISYLEMIEQTKTMLDSYANEIEQLRRIEVPGMDIVNRINKDIKAYKALALKYNALATRYNSLKDFLNDLEFVESKISLLCATGQTCTEKELKELNTEKLKIVEDIASLLSEQIEFYNGDNSKFDQSINDSLSSISNISNNFNSDTTEAQLNARMFEMLTVLTTEIVSLKKMLGKQYANTMSIEYSRQKSENAQLKNQIGNKYNPEKLEKKK